MLVQCFMYVYIQVSLSEYCAALCDCGICVSICPQTAISKREDKRLVDGYEYIVDDSLCIGCGFCAGACPCVIWDLVENAPLE